jgi:hypothetical protein
MRRLIAVLFGVSLALLAFGMVAATNGQEKQDKKLETPYVGHFQGSASQGELYLFDTTTGEVWMCGKGDHESGWRKIVRPLTRP